MTTVRAIGDNLTIKDAARAFHLSIDSLRFYEKAGLIKPPRKSNGYRYYDAKTFAVLSQIVEMREMGFSIEEIRKHLENRTLSSYIELLNDGIDTVSSRIAELERIRDGLISGIQNYANTLTRTQREEVHIGRLEARPCLLVSDEEVYYTDLPFLFTSKATELDSRMNMFECTPCYEVDPNRMRDDGIYLPNATLLYPGKNRKDDCDYLIPEGMYAYCYFKGSFLRSREVYAKIKSHAEKAGYVPTGNLYEFSLISDFETDASAEFTCRIDVRVIPRDA